MSTDSLRRIAQVLSGSRAGLGPMLAHGARLHRLTRELATRLSAPVGEHLQVVNINGGCLVLEADSPAWAARLRYLTPTVLAILEGQLGLPAKRVALQIRVRRAAGWSEGPPLPRPRHARLSKEAAAAIRAAALARPHDELRAALLRLARHAAVEPGP
jgi:predicted nucleic acid-binding Zn ribbon protein